MEEDQRHLEKVFSELPLYDQVINVTEAALINYFKPKYNKDFIENFPDPQHVGYRQYYDLDYNCITIELDLEFDTFPIIELRTEINNIKSCFDVIQYNLFNNNKRQNMYEMFRPVE